MRPHIGIVGQPRSSREAVAEHLTNKWGYRQLSFVDPLMEFLCEIDTQVYRSVRKHGWEGAKAEDTVVRVRLSEVEDAARRHLLPDVWIQRLLLDWPEDDCVPVVVSDARRSNEIRMLHERGAAFIHVRLQEYRGEPPPELPVRAYEVASSGSIHDLCEQIDRIFLDPACFWCGLPLESSPSDDFCGEQCERSWVASVNGVKQLSSIRRR